MVLAKEPGGSKADAVNAVLNAATSHHKFDIVTQTDP